MSFRVRHQKCSDRIRTVSAAVFFVIVASLVSGRTLMLLNQHGDRTTVGMQDFRDAAYFPAVSFLAGQNPYDAPHFTRNYPVRSPFPPYAPGSLLIHSPLGSLPQRTAEASYFVVSIVLTLVLSGLSMRVAGLKPSLDGVLFIGGLILLTRPGHQNLVLGQLTLPIVLFSTIALVTSRTRPVVSGLSAALSLCKPTYGLPIFGLLLLRRDRSALVWGVGAALVFNLFAFSLITMNCSATELISSLRATVFEFQSQNPTGSPVESFSRIDLPTTFARFTGYAGPKWSVPLMMCVVVLITGGISCRLLRTGESPVNRRTVHRMLLGLSCVGILISAYHQPHAMLLMVPYMVCLWTSITQQVASNSERVIFGLLAVVFLNYAATASVLSRIGGFASPYWLPIVSINGCILIVVFAMLATMTWNLQRANS